MPDLTIPTKEFLPIVNLSKAFTAKRDIVPALKYIYFQGDTIRAFSGEAGSVWFSPWTTPDEFAVPGDTLDRIISSLNTQGVEMLTMNKTESSVRIKGGGFRGQLPCLIESERSGFVLRDPPDEDVRVPLSPEFWKAVEQASLTISQDETKPMLRGVHWSASGNLMSTDAFRITIVYPEDGAGRVSPPNRKPLLIPDHLLQRLGARRREVSAVALDGGLLWFYLDSGAVFGSLLEAEFPAARPVQIIKKARDGASTGGTHISIPSGPMLDLVLSRLVLFADAPTFKINAAVTKDSLILSAGEAAEETLPAVVEGEPGSFSVNGKFFNEALMQVGSKFWSQLDDETMPLYFLSESRQIEHVILRLIA